MRETQGPLKTFVKHWNRHPAAVLRKVCVLLTATVKQIIVSTSPTHYPHGLGTFQPKTISGMAEALPAA